MGCVNSVESKPEFKREKKRIAISPKREACSILSLEKDTTASGRNSTRRSPTIWDLQLERERHAETSNRYSARSPFSSNMSLRSFSGSGRMFTPAPSEDRLIGRDRRESSQTRQGMIPSWNHYQLQPAPLTRSRSGRSGSVTCPSPRSSSYYMSRSLHTSSTFSPSGRSSYYGQSSPVLSQPASDYSSQSRMRSSKSLSSFTDISSSSRAGAYCGHRRQNQVQVSRMRLSE